MHSSIGRLLERFHLISDLNVIGVELVSIYDPIYTTYFPEEIDFIIFSSVAEFERDLISEQTMAGLKAARARGRRGGRRPSLSLEAENTAIAALALYKERELSIQEICDQLKIARPTLYKYLRHKNVKIGS